MKMALKLPITFFQDKISEWSMVNSECSLFAGKVANLKQIIDYSPLTIHVY